MYNVASILKPAYNRAATIENAASGFRNTDIWPMVRKVFKDHKFVAADNLLQNKNIGLNNTTIIENVENQSLTQGRR